MNECICLTNSMESRYMHVATMQPMWEDWR